jgi:hypothetical protein
VLRTLAPLLRQLEKGLRGWMGAKHLFPRSIITNATLEGLANDLHRQAEALDVDRPLLVIMLMGGTGVGKSSLLNALAGGAIAKASFARPTTMDPVVYYHESVRPERFDPALRMCHLASHDRGALQHKIIVDTPDLDSTVRDNFDKVTRMLPVADVVLYVGSQEKYHDKLIVEVFKQQRKRRAFAFILNKWDRCLHAGAAGLRPDEDWLQDLKAEGFQNPVLFRTCAQYWVDKVNGQSNGELPEGEQFPALSEWLENGLNRLEIDAIKGRGISQLLEHLQKALQDAAPPDLGDVAVKTRAAWERMLADEGHATGDVLLNTLEPYQHEIEHHFTLQSQRRFRGLMAGYLNLVTRARYLGTSLRDRMSFLPKPSAPVETQTTWDLTHFTKACTTVAGERHLDARNRALADRLLVEADKLGFPLELLNEPTQSAAKIDWRQRYADALVEVLKEVEQQWSTPTGWRRWLQTGTTIVGNIVPPVVLLAAYCIMLWDFFVVRHWSPDLTTVLLLPWAITLVFLVMLHIVITFLLPLRWSKIRSEFHDRLEERIKTALSSAFAPIPQDRAEALRQERREAERLVGEVREVAGWLEQRQQAANISGLYGN